MIKAIETQYKGYRFRSRLEARWAVFFDAMKWRWEYEKEGFNIDGLNYLPDFWLPDVNSFVEVKPYDPKGIELQKIKALAKSKRVIVATGTPEAVPYLMYGYDSEDDEGGGDYLTCILFTDYKGQLGNVFYTWSDDRTEIDWSGMFTRSDLSAMNAARAARFEHGETP